MARPLGHVEESPFYLHWDHLDWVAVARGLGSRGFASRIVLDSVFDSEQLSFPESNPAALATAAAGLAAEALSTEIDAANALQQRAEAVFEEIESAAIAVQAARSSNSGSNEEFDHPIELDNDKKAEVLAMLEEALPTALAMLSEAVTKAFPDAAFHRDGISPGLLKVLTADAVPGLDPAPIGPPIDVFG